MSTVVVIPQAAQTVAVTPKGDTGDSIELQKSATHIQYKPTLEAVWINLVALADLKGADGLNVELQKSATHIQWRVTGGEWADLVALIDLKGADGTSELLGSYEYNENTVLPPVAAIDYTTSTITFSSPHGIVGIPYFHSHFCIAVFNDYSIKDNVKAIPSGLITSAAMRIVENISDTSFRFSTVAAGTTQVLANTDPTLIDFSKWHFEFSLAKTINISIPPQKSILMNVISKCQMGQFYVDPMPDNITGTENVPNIGQLPSQAITFTTFKASIIGGLITRSTRHECMFIKTTGITRGTYDFGYLHKAPNATSIISIAFNTIYPQFANGTIFKIYK